MVPGGRKIFQALDEQPELSKAKTGQTDRNHPGGPCYPPGGVDLSHPDLIKYNTALLVPAGDRCGFVFGPVNELPEPAIPNERILYNLR